MSSLMCYSETDDSSSIPMPERTEVSPSSRKPSIHLTLPDFQDTSTGLFSRLLKSFRNDMSLCIFGLQHAELISLS